MKILTNLTHTNECSAVYLFNLNQYYYTIKVDYFNGRKYLTIKRHKHNLHCYFYTTISIKDEVKIKNVINFLR